MPDEVKMFYDKCLKCRGLDTRPGAQCNCPRNSREKLKAQAEKLAGKSFESGEQRGKP